MTALSDTVRVALSAGHLAHLVTLDPDGGPQVSVVWVGVEGDEIVSGHLGNRRKLDNIRRDPRVALSMETGGAEPSGLAHYLVVHGRARITEGAPPSSSSAWQPCTWAGGCASRLWTIHPRDWCCASRPSVWEGWGLGPEPSLTRRPGPDARHIQHFVFYCLICRRRCRR